MKCAQVSEALEVPIFSLNNHLSLQAESRRIEGVLYGEYWAMLGREGFKVIELPLAEFLGPDLGLPSQEAIPSRGAQEQQTHHLTTESEHAPNRNPEDGQLKDSFVPPEPQYVQAEPERVRAWAICR